ncbi:MAG: YdiU family protein [Candidatus Omnitrophota bacterium]|jgi:uncharacterized protein YdiU (UPF0061 family)
MSSQNDSFHKPHGIRFETSYARLPERFYERIHPVPVKAPRLVQWNDACAKELGIDSEDLSLEERAFIFSGNVLLPGAEPIALAYAGHQFGHFVPQLGDGRAVLLGEVFDLYGKRRDIQLKGSGQTRFSRQGDGRAALGPMIREYIVSEAMHALGIPTTRSLALVTTGEPVYREAVQPGAILARVAASHIRVGTFEYFAAGQDQEALKILADYVIGRHFPGAQKAENPYAALLKAVVDAQATLVARWMHAGFIHGVMNTDNTSISGETIDYGPCAFLDAYDPATVFSSIDHHGRYAFGNQGPIAAQNLAGLADCLLPLLHEDPQQALALSKEIVGSFPILFNRYWLEGMCAKIGLKQGQPEDLPLIQDLLTLMKGHQADYTLSFRALCGGIDEKFDAAALRILFSNSGEFDQWLIRWRRRLVGEGKPASEIAEKMLRVNPAFIPRNHRVEQAIEAAVEQHDLSKMAHLIEVLSRPYDDQPANAEYMNPPKPEERVTQTFCGT